jgi:hypothetical protein
MMMRKAAAVAASVLTAATLSVSPTEAATGVLDGAFSWPGYVGYQFGGALCPCEVVPGYANWPSQQNITQGAVAIDQWLARNAAAPTTTVILGTSEGAQAAYRYGRWHPQSTQQFITTGNPERKYGGIFAPLGEGVPPGGVYTDVAIQYDFFADFPNNPDSPYFFLAVINVVAGGFWTHIVGYNSVNLYDPNNRVWAEGNITYILIPDRPHLWGVSQQQIEDAYIRPTGPVIYGTAPTQEVSTFSPETQAESLSTTRIAEPMSTTRTAPSTGSVSSAVTQVQSDPMTTAASKYERVSTSLPESDSPSPKTRNSFKAEPGGTPSATTSKDTNPEPAVSTAQSGTEPGATTAASGATPTTAASDAATPRGRKADKRGKGDDDADE